MSRLTQRTYWDSVHVLEQREFSDAVLIRESSHVPPRKRFTGILKKCLGRTILERISSYDDYLLWDVILPRVVPKLNGGSCVEIGSAPGYHLVEFSNRYGGNPYGVEYSAVGVEVNRDVFKQNGFNPDNVIHADFFSDDFIAGHKEKFDVVMSGGFIEHFEDVKPVVDRHMELLKPGGYLIVTVPNLRGANSLLSWLFDEGAIPRHNCKIMRKSMYRTLFDRKDLQSLFCDYYGTFSFYLFTAGCSVLRGCLLRVCHRFQPVLNLVMRTIFGRKGAETSMFSPFLM